MEPNERLVVDLDEMEEWRVRNQRDRYRMIDEYAAWLKTKGILTVEKNLGRPAVGPLTPGDSKRRDQRATRAH